jgi:DNA topoisomerase IB
MTFAFKGKSGKEHEVEVADRRLARIVARCQELPGQQLFQYVDEDGERHGVASDDVNEYLREVTGEDFSAKDFRTWAGTVLAAMALQEFREFDTEADAKRNVVRAIETVAEKLGNTPAVSRASYVHPQVIDAYLGGSIEAIERSGTRAAPATQTDDVESVLRGVRGLGPARARTLVEAFGSNGSLHGATVDELQQVPGVGPALAQRIRDALDA